MVPSSPRSSQRWRCLVVAMLALVLSVSACATIPTGGPVHQGRDLAQEPDPQLPRSLGRDPQPGDGPEAIVRGFLQSGADFLDDHKYAREYLSPDVRTRWNPGKGTSIYDRAQGLSVVIEPDSTTALVTSTEVARIDEDGRYHQIAQHTVETQFGLTRIGGHWRINKVGNGLLLSSSDVDTAYRQVNLYFLAPTSHTVVPDPVLLPDLPGLTSKLVTRLLEGPTEPLRGAVETAFPQGTRLEVGSVPVRDGLATVRLDAAALRGGKEARDGMSAQIVWTLRQLRDIERIRILAGGDDLDSGSSVPREQPRSLWPSYDPDILGASASLYAVRDGRVGRLSGTRFTPVRGPAGTVRLGPDAAWRRPAISIDGTRIAVMNAKSTELFVGRLTTGAPLVQVALGPAAVVSEPSWDSSGELWFIDRTTNRLQLLSQDDTHVLTVAMPKISAGPLQVVRVAREGTRIALAAGVGAASHFFLGAVERGPNGNVQAITGVHEVLPDVQGVRDISWIDADTLVVIGNRVNEPPVALRTDPDGFTVDDDIDALRGIAAITGAPADTKLPLVASTDAGQLQQWDANLGWQPLGPGRDPIYPG
jgi:Lipoprotein LpqB beta-propeller domain/Sporulation and spore germination